MSKPKTRAKKPLAKTKAKKHTCVREVNRALERRGEELTWALSLTGAPERIFVATNKLTMKGQSPSSASAGSLLAANYCPFCGVKMAEG